MTVGCRCGSRRRLASVRLWPTSIRSRQPGSVTRLRSSQLSQLTVNSASSQLGLRRLHGGRAHTGHKALVTIAHAAHCPDLGSAAAASGNRGVSGIFTNLFLAGTQVAPPSE